MKQDRAVPNDLDLGLEFASGLTSPHPQIPKTTDPLYLLHPYTDDGSQKGMQSTVYKRLVRDSMWHAKATRMSCSKYQKPKQYDDTVLIKRKFPPRPLNNAELNDCQKQLAPSELVGYV